MQAHAMHLSNLKHLMEIQNISKEKNNGADLLDRTDKHSLFESQQMLMETAVHSSDLSVPTRPSFDLQKQFTYLLFEEFFHQGDCERAAHLEVSYLCDRKTTNIAGAQPGFIQYIVQPLWR